MRLAVVVINYRTPELTLAALRSSLRELEGLPGSRVILVDNDSQDGSFEKLQAAVRDLGAEERVHLVASPRNGGFAYGVNQGVRAAAETGPPVDYVYLLNSDAEPDPGALALLVEFLEAHPQAGIAGSHIYGTDGATHDTAFRFHSLPAEFENRLGLGVVSRLLDRWVVSKPVPHTDTRVDWLAGASMLIRRQVFEAIGPFDERYFLYFEEADFCRRAQAAGWATWYVPSSRVQHVGSASTGWTDWSRRRPPYWFESRRHYWLKNHGRLQLWLANALWITGFLLGRAKCWLQRKPYPQPPHFFRDFLRYTLFPRRRPANGSA
ncbi:MAG: glycosyltransferase family 2 protein [Proteobacteria bacterium]|nr:glycosyltransferase family 2 protein [Pseudomonadota bacterium]